MTSAYHHVGVHVSDIEEGSRFYAAVFGAKVLVKPYTVAGEVTELITGVKGASMVMCQLGLDEGFVELFQFLPAELEPSEPVPYTHQRVLHFGMQVDDVEATLALVEAHGGSRIFDPRPLAGGTVSYCRDPDGNVIELADRGMDALVATIAAREQA